MTQPSKILWPFFVAALLLVAQRAAAQNVPPATNVSQEAAKAPKVRLADAYGRLPLSFEANQGQTDRRVKFLSRSAGKTLFLTSTEAVLVLTSREKNDPGSSRTNEKSLDSRESALRMKLLGVNRDAEVTGLERLPGTSNYIIGNDPAKWRSGLTEYRKVRYREIYPGVDLVYYGNSEDLEYDFVVAPGAHPEQIRLTIRGASKLWIDANGNAVLHCVAGDLQMMKPRIYQKVDGREIAVAGGYQLEGHELRFAIAHFNPHQPLIIDPVLSYSTYLGGDGADGAQAIAVDATGNAYITGTTSSTDFPGVGSGSFQSTPSHLYVSKLNAAGTAILYSTYLGSSGVDRSSGIAVDSSGNAYVTGYTNGTNFPITAGAFQGLNSGGYDAFITKLNPSGTALVYSTYLGGSNDDSGLAIALDAAGNAYLTGQTGSPDFPGAPSSPIQSTNHLLDAFVAELNAAGSALIYSTYLGGNGYDEGVAIAVDSAGNAYVTGRTNSTDFPGISASSIQASNGGLYDAFVSKVNAAGTALVYSTYLGGSDYDYGYGITVDTAGNAYVTGYTSSINFTGVTSSSLQPSLGTNNGNAFVAKLNPAGSALAYSTYLGGSGGDNGTAIATDSSGNTWVTGTTSSTNFPGVNANSIQSTPGGLSDAFVTELNPAGSTLLYSTYLGGNQNDSGSAIAVDPAGDVYVAGTTQSPNFPIGPSPIQTALRGGSDAFVTKLSASGAAATKTALVSSPNPSASGQTVTLTASVSVMGGGGTPTGTVSFNDGTTSLGSAPLTNPVLMVSSLNVGLHLVTATYSGDSNFAPSTSAPVDQSVNKQFASMTTLVSSATSSAFGQSVTFTATVAGVGSGPLVPSGNVVFEDGANQLGTAMLDAAGLAAFTTSVLTAGSHSITATYTGDASFVGSTSPPITETLVWPPPFQGPPSVTALSVGNQPVAMALNPVTDRIYVANEASNSVTVIDASVNAVIAMVGVGQAPDAIAVNTQTNTIYTADHDSSTVTVIDGATTTVVKSVPLIDTLVGLPIPPVAIAVDERDNQIYVGSAGPSFAIIDGATYTVSSIDYLEAPIALAVSRLSGRNYVAFSHDSDIADYEGATGVQLGDFNSGFMRPVALAANAATGKILAADSTGTLDMIDEAKNVVTRSSVGTTPVTLSTTVPGGAHQVSVSSSTGDLGVTYAATGAALTPANTSQKLSTTAPVSGSVSISGVGQDAGVYYTQTGQPLQRVASVSGSSIQSMIYAVTIDSSGLATYTFGSADAGQQVTISYYVFLQQGQYRVSGSLYTFSTADVGAAVVISHNAADLPYALAVDARDSRVYVANQSPVAGLPASVTVSDAATGVALSSIPVGQTAVPVTIPAPNKIAVDEGSDFIYVANDASNNVTIIDGATTSAVANVAVGNSPSALVRDPFSCSVYAANTGSGTVSVIARSSSGADVCFSDSPLSFGRQAVGTTSAAQSVVVTNIGHADLVISSVATTGDFAAGGDCSPSSAGASIVLHPGQRCTIQVMFMPTAFGIRNGQITVTDNAGSGRQVIALGGDGTISLNVQMTANPNPVVYGQFPVLGVTVTPGPGEPTPFGSVTFLLDGQTILGSQILDSTGSATLQNSSVPFQIPVGQHTLTAKCCGGDVNYSPTVSPAVNLVITKATTFISVDVLTSTTPNQIEVFVSPLSYSGIPSGMVALQEGQNTFASITLGVKYGEGYGAIPVLLPPGTHTVTAVYQGDANFLGSSSSPFVVSVQAPQTPTTTTVTSSSPTSTFGSPVTFTAAVTANPAGAAANIAGNVSFFVDGQSLSGSTPISGTPSSASASASPITTLTVGQHSITAQFQDPTGQFSPSTSAAFTQTVQATGGGGGTGGCACTKTGNYTDPAAAIDVAAGTPVSGAFDSPNMKYTLTISPNDTNKQTTITVTPKGGGTPLFNFTGPFSTNAGFSPDGDRLAMHYMQPVPGQAGQSIDNYFVFDLSSATPSQPITNPGQAIVYDSPTVENQRLQFSPSGRYFLYTALLGNQQTDVFIYRVQGVAQTHEPPIYHSFPFSFLVAPGTTFSEPANPETEDKDTGGVGWGFSPDKPETGFVYAYGTGSGIFQWVLVNLAAGTTAKSVAYGGAGAGVISAFWQFSPCADVAAVVWQPNTSQEQVDWYGTSTGAALSGSGGAFPLTSITLETTSSGQEAVDSSGQVQAKSPSSCGQPNTPAPPPGTPSSVTPMDSGSSTSPVTLIFSGVAQPGQTTLTVSSTPPSPPTPNAFQLGNPPMYYNLSSTATFTPPVTICINYVGVSFNNNSAIAIYHYDSSLNPPAWVNITVPNSQVSPPPPPNTVCGKSNSLSPFGLFEPSGSNPANIVVSAGAPQTATIATAFVTPLQATVTGSSGNPLSGIRVTFSAPAADATGSFGGATLAFATTNASGVATAPVFTANGTVGSYSVTATANGVATPALFSLTNALQQATTSISAPSVTYGTAASVAVAVNSTGQGVTGSVMLSVDGAAGITMPLANGSAVFNLGTLNAGSHALSANFAAQGSFSASTANATLVVTQAPLTLTADNKSKIYGAGTPNLTFSASGFVNGDTAASLTAQPNLSTTATAASGVGSYPITIGGAVDANYSITYVQGTLTVTPSSLTLTADNKSKVYGAATPNLTFSASGFINGDTAASLTAQPNLSTTAAAASGVGSYPITIGGAVVANYSITYVQGTLTVTPAPLTVTAGNAQKVYGAANPAFTGTITGIQNGDNISATYATAATPASPVGIYAIAPTLLDPTGKLGNYKVTLINGTLTVVQASTTTTLSASPNPSTFGQSVTLTATVAPVTPGAGTATGKVTFFDGTVTLGTSTLNSADTTTFTTSSLAAGSQSFTASYGGDPNFSASSSSAVSDQVQCGVLISLSPSTVPVGGTVTVSGKVISCSTTTQMVVVKFSLSGPSQPNSCSSTKSEMFTTPPFPLPPKISQTVSFRFKVPSKGVCPGTYSITAATLVNGVAVDTSTASLTITAH